MRTFKCTFGDGSSVEIKVCNTLPPVGSAHIQAVKWSTKPSPAVVPAYVAWMNSVNQLLVDEWNISLMHIFVLAPNPSEIWFYRPGKDPEYFGSLNSISQKTPL